MISRLSLIAACVVAGSFLVPPASAQDICVQYHLVPHTVYEKQQVTRYRWVNETSYETRQVTEQVPVYSTEKRERVTVTYEPHTTTTMKDEYYDVLRPVTETSYRDRTWEETTYETVTEMRDQDYVVEKPVTETQYRTERVLVRKPVVNTEMRTEDITTYRPVQTLETQYVPSPVVTNQLVQTPTRSRLDWLQRGYHWDPTTGQYVFRRGGLHWTNPGNVITSQPTVTMGLVPQQQARTTYVPETTRRQRPVEVLRYDEHIETRRVPIEVQRTERRIETRKVPVEVRRPVTRTRTERVPFTETRMERVTKVRRVPVETTELRRVEKVEPYERTTARWVEKTREVREPRTVARRVPYTETVMVPRTVWMKVPVDAFGNVIGNPIPVESSTTTRSASPADQVPALRETSRKIPNDSTSSVLERNLSETSVRNNRAPLERIVYDRPARQPTPVSRTPDDSIIVPETTPSVDNAETTLGQVNRKPAAKDTEETGNRTIEDDPVRILPLEEQEEDKAGNDGPTPMNGTVVPNKSDDDDSQPSDELDDDLTNADPRIT